MATKITRDIIESYLSCKYKAHLKLAGQQGTQSDYGHLLAASRADVRRRAIDKLLSRCPPVEVVSDVALALPTFKRGAAYVVNATLQDDNLALAFRAFWRAGAGNCAHSGGAGRRLNSARRRGGREGAVVCRMAVVLRGRLPDACGSTRSAARVPVG